MQIAAGRREGTLISCLTAHLTQNLSSMHSESDGDNAHQSLRRKITQLKVLHFKLNEHGEPWRILKFHCCLQIYSFKMNVPLSYIERGVASAIVSYSKGGVVSVVSVTEKEVWPLWLSVSVKEV